MTTMINTPSPTLHCLDGLSFVAKQPFPSAAAGACRKAASAFYARRRSSFVERMLADPLIRLVMAADRVTAAEIRQLYHGSPDERLSSRTGLPAGKAKTHFPAAPTPGPVPGSQRPGIGE